MLQPGDPRLPPGGSTGGGGGNRVAYITLPSIPRPPSPSRFEVRAPVTLPKLEKTPVPEPVTPAPALTQPLDTVAVAVADTVRAGTQAASGDAGQVGQVGAGAGGAQGPGGGAGPGAGGGGQGGTLRPPEPRVISPPFDAPPKELRGVSLNVTFWVRVDGRVERYEVRPEIKDREYAKKFDEVMRAFRFTPARAPDGTTVAGTTTISFTLPGKRSS
jgi:hypothetical protein